MVWRSDDLAPKARTVDGCESRSHHELKPWLKTLLVGICRGIESFQGFIDGSGFRPASAFRTLSICNAAWSHAAWGSNRRACFVVQEALMPNRPPTFG